MLSTSHLEPMNASETQAGSAVLLASAFTEFISASSRLENSYRQLQDEVTALRLELSAQNAALTQSLAQNRRMHLHLQQVVDSMPCGVLVLDKDGATSMINPESVRLLGLDRNVLGGARLLKLLLDRYGGDLSLTLSAYNAGTRKVDAAMGVPMIPETIDYVSRILSRLADSQSVRDNAPDISFRLVGSDGGK